MVSPTATAELVGAFLAAIGYGRYPNDLIKPSSLTSNLRNISNSSSSSIRNITEKGLPGLPPKVPSCYFHFHVAGEHAGKYIG